MTDLEKRAAKMKWNPPPPGSEERRKMPQSAFLAAGKLFPYKVLIDGQWVISVPGLRSAISVANFRGNTVISKKASAILERLQASEIKHSEFINRGKTAVLNILKGR